MDSPRPRPLSRLLLVLAAVAVTMLGLVGPAHAAPWCSLTWGSQPEGDPSGPGSAGAVVHDVRAGQHACFDRLVVDVSGATRVGYDVRYVPQLVADGSGRPVPVRGGAVLQVVVHAPAYDANGSATYRPADPRELVRTTGWATFRQVAWAGSFEGSTTVGIGTRARLPFRVAVLTGPGSGSRVVVDVAHRW
ncbi:AMIN-like domain-containing (lipo)protein [Modestobacter versicolor]|uniref:AMIN-like domain-containing (lipo)protein n=1 Tax=Modestobacter versicolor TaxID=429133 RepID=UPI0034E023DB